MAGWGRDSRRALIALVACAVLLLAASVPAAAQARYSTMWIFYGSGWFLDRDAGVRRLVAALNLSQLSVEDYPGNASFETFSQMYVQFSIPEDASGPENGTGLRIRFVYYVDARCIGLASEACPLGEHDNAASTDLMDLEIRRVIEYRDGNGNRRYDEGEEVAAEILLSRPQSPSVQATPFGKNWTSLELPYNFNYTDPEGYLKQGVLYEGDPPLRDLWAFRIAVSNGYPANLTINSFLFLRPTTYKGIPLTPTEVKLDVLMDGIQYAGNDTAMALEIFLSSSQFRLQSNQTTAAYSVFTSSEAAVAFFTWSSGATVDGQPAPVGSSIVPSTDSTATIYLSYSRGGTILHDPVLGVSSKGLVEGPPGGSTSSVPLIVAIGAIITVAAAVAIVSLRHARRRS